MEGEAGAFQRPTASPSSETRTALPSNLSSQQYLTSMSKRTKTLRAAEGDIYQPRMAECGKGGRSCTTDNAWKDQEATMESFWDNFTARGSQGKGVKTMKEAKANPLLIYQPFP
jgi:hypothetical protein